MSEFLDVLRTEKKYGISKGAYKALNIKELKKILNKQFGNVNVIVAM